MNAETIDLNGRIKIQPNALSVDMDGEKVAMNMDDDQFYGINGIGSLIWSLIEEQEITVQDLLSMLTNHFNQDDPEQIKNESIQFLTECRDYGVLLIG
jgi:hypothetical protein